MCVCVFPLWEVGRNCREGAPEERYLPGHQLWLWRWPSYAASQSVWVKPGSGSVAKYELPDLTLALYNCCLAEYIWDVSRTRGECDFACFSQDLNLAELIRKTQRSHCAKPVSELALLPGESHKVKVRGEEGLRECCGGRCWNTLGDLRSDTE